MPVTMEELEALRRELSELPANKPKIVSKQNAVAELATELAAAQRRGYSVDDLAKLLAAKGLALTPGTLRGYLRRTRKKRRPAKSGSPSSDLATPGSAGVGSRNATQAQHQGSVRERHAVAPAHIPPARSHSNGPGRGAESPEGKGTSPVVGPPRTGTRGSGTA
jgi:hypothetical protein